MVRLISVSLAMFRQEHPGDRLASAAHAPTWIFLTAARVAFGADEDVGEIEAEDVVCLLASLIDQVGSAARRSSSERDTSQGGYRISRHSCRSQSKQGQYQAFRQWWTSGAGSKWIIMHFRSIHTLCRRCSSCDGNARCKRAGTDKGGRLSG